MQQQEARIFADYIEAYLTFTKDHEATKKVHLWTVISVLAGALERKVWLDRGYYTLFPNMFIFIIGKSGLVKKSTTTAIGVNLLREIPNGRMMSERLTAGSLIDQLVHSRRKFKHKEKEIDQCALFAYASELSVFMGEVFGSIIELLTTFYDCQPNDSSKPWIYKTKHGEEEKIFGPCLNILGASTKAWLKRCIPDQEMEGGFTSRVIFVVENNPPDKLVAWPEVSGEKEVLRKNLVKDLIRISKLTGPMTVDLEAREWFTKWYENHMEVTMQANVHPRFIGYLSRKGDHILKLAMVRSVSLGSDLVIRGAHIKWAEKMLSFIEDDMVTAFEDAVSELEMERMVRLGKGKKPVPLLSASMIPRPETVPFRMNPEHYRPQVAPMPMPQAPAPVPMVMPEPRLPKERKSRVLPPPPVPRQVTAETIRDYIRARNAVSRNELLREFRSVNTGKFLTNLIERGDIKMMERNRLMFFIFVGGEDARAQK